MLLKIFVMTLLFCVWFVVGYLVAAWELATLLTKFFNEQGAEKFIDFMKKAENLDSE